MPAVALLTAPQPIRTVSNQVSSDGECVLTIEVHCIRAISDVIAESIENVGDTDDFGSQCGNYVQHAVFDV